MACGAEPAGPVAAQADRGDWSPDERRRIARTCPGASLLAARVRAGVKATVSLNVRPRAEARGSRWRRARGLAFAVWMGLLSVLTVALFVGVTALTIGMWLA